MASEEHQRVADAGPSPTPFKSFLEACDCLEAEEALQEVGIVRVADLLELDAELVAILELPEHVQQRPSSLPSKWRSSQ